jgi:Polyketide cyclase / dehydrase and lipid transport
VKPVTVSVEVPNPRQQVWDYLDLLANHERFTDHFLLDWELSGPPRGVGAKASFRVKATNDKDWTELRVIEADPPRRSVEESVGGSRAQRKSRGTYTLEELPGGGTRITFEIINLEMPLSERAMGPLNSAYLRRVNRKAMKRLAGELAKLRG